MSEINVSQTQPNRGVPAPEIPSLSDIEAARLLGVSVATVRKWRLRRIGPACFKVGTSVRYRRCDLLAFATRQAVVQAAA